MRLEEAEAEACRGDSERKEVCKNVRYRNVVVCYSGMIGGLKHLGVSEKITPQKFD